MREPEYPFNVELPKPQKRSRRRRKQKSIGMNYYRDQVKRLKKELGW